MHQSLLPDPWVPHFPFTDALVMTPISPAASTGWTANRAYYIPVIFPASATLYALRAAGGNTTGNYDLALYDANGTRLATKGSTAMAAAVLSLTLPEIRVHAGTLYYAAVVTDNNSASLYGLVHAGTRYWAATGCANEESAFPLPVSATRVGMISVKVPLIAFGVR